MAAWKHWAYWDEGAYESYRKYVAARAPSYRNRLENCADISIMLLIDFAAENGLPVTFWDNADVRYISKATRQHPDDPRLLGTHKWSSKSEYVDKVKRRVSAESLFLRNTVRNPVGPQPGDLLCARDHTALVFAVYPPGATHPKAGDPAIPLFPGNDVAKTQVYQTEYFRGLSPGSKDLRPNEADVDTHVDYLNHRGLGKEKAELIYYAAVRELKNLNLDFYKYKPGVLDNWKDWNGEGDLPR